MARRPKFFAERDPLPEAMDKHLHTLGFYWSVGYLDWCRQNGFEPSLDKNRYALMAEIEAWQALQQRRKTHQRIHKKPKQFLEAVCLGTLSPENIERPAFKAIADEIAQSYAEPEVRKSLLSMLQGLLKHNDLPLAATANGVPFVRGLIKLHDRRGIWVRKIEDWVPKSKNPQRRFFDLCHHLFDQYGDVPAFMDSVWLRNDRPSARYRNWFVHLGQGRNIRSAKLPVNLTKKMAHFFGQTPDNYSAEQAIRNAQLRAMGAPRPIIEAVCGTRLARGFKNEDFWVTFLEFLSRNTMLDPRQVGPIVDYLQAQKFEETAIELAPGQWRNEPPPQPGLSMRNRNVGVLLRQVEEWHGNLNRHSVDTGVVYPAARFEGYIQKKGSVSTPKSWHIRQLRSGRDLEIEGRTLNHCVASYHQSCVSGRCTIWSLSEYTDDQNFERLLTIEVDNTQTIVQCRGLANRAPKPPEWKIIQDWAERRDLSIAQFLA